MCIVAIAWQLFDEMPLVLLSNRDEFFARTTTPAHQWKEAPILAGQDNRSGGTWLGIHQYNTQNQPSNAHSNRVAHNLLPATVHQNGRWATVLNFRDGVQADADQHSRGELVTNFLTSEVSPMAYARQIELTAYAGFNLIVGDSEQAVLVNNRGYPPTALTNGLHIVSNGQPDADWFKTERLRGRVRQEVLPLISESLAFHSGSIDYWQPAAWQVLSDTLQAPTDQLPDTGMPLELEQALSAICIDTPEMPTYGTRTQSILTMKQSTKATAMISATSMSRPPIKIGRPVLKLTSRDYQSGIPIETTNRECR